MLTIDQEQRSKSPSPSVPSRRRRLYPAILLAALLVLLPWPSRGRQFSSVVFRRLPPPVINTNIADKPILRNEGAFSNVLARLHSFRGAIRNRRYLTVIDFTKPSSKKRMYLVDLKTGKVEKYLVSHGKNSGWAYATAFSNRPESFQSCRGFFVTGRKYYGKHGVELQLVGLEKGINDNALKRGIVMHGADYVSMRSVVLNGGRLGRSLGCPAIPTAVAGSVINRIKGGSLLYIHAAAGRHASAQTRDEAALNHF